MTDPLHRHGNRISAHTPPRYIPEVRKIPASSVPYGDSITRNGRTVFAAYYDGTLVSVGATAGEARAKFRQEMRRREG
jgi:hypothetical protein